jgi:myo-inositol-1(or 4)-monophosphatase
MSLTKIAAGVERILRTAGQDLLALPTAAPTNTPADLSARLDAIDRLVTDQVAPALRALQPGAGTAAEFDAVPPTGEHWLLDPTDGVVQLVQDLPYWCLTATLLRDGRAVLAVLHHPVIGATYRAVEGGGAVRDGRPVTPSTKTEPAITLAATSHPPFQARDPRAVTAAGRAYAAVLGVAGAVRNLGPTAWQIADVASGRLDAFWEFGVDDGNLVGPALIAREAGVTVTDTTGHEWTPGATSFLAAPPQLHPTFLAALRDTDPVPR